MNKTKNISAFILLFSVVLFISCNVEPFEGTIPGAIVDPGTNPGVSTGIVGSYRMTAFNTSEQTDLNDDGIESTNQMTETACFNNNIITLNDNNTFTSTDNGVEIFFSGTTEVIDCYNDPSFSGVYTLVGSTLTLNYSIAGESYTQNFTVAGNLLKNNLSQYEVVGTTSTGEPVYITSDLEIVFTKQ